MLQSTAESSAGSRASSRLLGCPSAKPKTSQILHPIVLQCLIQCHYSALGPETSYLCIFLPQCVIRFTYASFKSVTQMKIIKPHKRHRIIKEYINNLVVFLFDEIPTWVVTACLSVKVSLISVYKLYNVWFVIGTQFLVLYL